MTVHKKLIDKILQKRNAQLYDFLEGKGSLELPREKIAALIEEVDRIFYTLDFLQDQNLVEIKKANPTLISHRLFNGLGSEEDDIDGLIFYEAKLKIAMGWEIEVKPGLLAFRDNGYKTDEQQKRAHDFWLAIFVAILSSVLTAVATAYFQTY